MAQWRTKADLLNALQQERAMWEALLAEIGQEHMTEPGATGPWTFKDVLAHLTGWRENSLAQLDAARNGVAQPTLPWSEDDDVDRTNQRIYERNRDRSLHEIVTAWWASFDQLEAGITALPEQALFDPQRFAWTGGKPLGPAIVSGTLSHYHDEHAATIDQWRATLGQRHATE